jgi:glutamate-5-semialdehyde dehydrogenase
MSVAPVKPDVRRAARRLAATSEAERDAALEQIALGIERRADEILAANALDGEAAAGERPAIRDRLALDDDRVAALAAAVRAVAALPSPVGETIRELRPPSGIRIRKVRVPLGVVLVVYEARPNVTVDAAAVCLKSANACILRGSRMAPNTNRVLTDIVHDELAALIADPATADVVIPRGGEELKKLLLRESRIPVLAAAGGNCHVYVDAAADADRAVAIALNAKVQRPGVCNAAETLLVHRARPELLERISAELESAGVELAEGEEAFATEFLDMKVAVGTVDSLDEAIEHINRYGTGHSEAIVTEDEAVAARFTGEVDAAAVYVNASTRFTDGGEYGMGAEIGNSTNRLHARGPIGLEELTTTKYVVHGDGHVRE